MGKTKIAGIKKVKAFKDGMIILIDMIKLFQKRCLKNFKF